MNLLFIRLSISVIQFLLIAKSNSFLGIFENTILLLGLRSFLALSPFFALIFKSWSIFSGLIISSIGIICLIIGYQLIGVIAIACGFSVANFLLRSHASTNLSSAANFRLVFHIGNIISGILFSILLTENLFWTTCFILISTTILSAIPGKNNQFSYLSQPKKYYLFQVKFNKTNIINYSAWICFGIALGIQSYSAFIVLPQYLIYYYTMVPKWFGLTISMYSFFTVLGLLFIALYKKYFHLKYCCIYLGLNSIFIGLPQLFHAEKFQGALIWVITLSIANGFVAPIMDSYSAKDKSLLIKELSVGIGAAITVICMRVCQSSELLAFIALCSILIGYYLKFHLLQNSTESATEKIIK